MENNSQSNQSDKIHYDEKYFNWQKQSGMFGGWALKNEFSSFISANDEVLDFGCGGGFLLANIDCRKKIGVEINDIAAEAAKENCHEVYRYLDEVPNDYVDVIISNHALEHTHNPLDEVKKMFKILRKNGKIIVIVPCDNVTFKYKPNDIHQHLFSWSPMNIGNLFTLGGFSVISSKSYIHKWPPKHEIIAKICGRRLFDVICRIYGHIKRKWFQVKIIAEKKY